MKQIIFLFLLAFGAALGDENKTRIFLDKYTPDRIFEPYRNLAVSTERIEADYNRSLAELNLTLPNMPNMLEAAKDSVNSTKSDSMRGEVKKAEDYILYDLPMIAKNPSVAATIPSIAAKSVARNERLFAVISSSMPRNLLKHYALMAEASKGQITLVLRGAVNGNIRETAKWFEGIKPRKESALELQINPKLIRRFGIDRVPALLLVQNFNPVVLENTDTIGKPDKNEEYWIYYGDTDLRYWLRDIAAKSPLAKTTLELLPKN
jgi:type-F conjugative transfer system pilin assembly protein TrbC